MRISLILQHLCGRLLTSAKDVRSSIGKTPLEPKMKDKNADTISVDSLISMAAQFPFRSGARRFLVVFSDNKVCNTWASHGRTWLSGIQLTWVCEVSLS
jgi:hypothetical protein